MINVHQLNKLNINDVNVNNNNITLADIFPDIITSISINSDGVMSITKANGNVSNMNIIAHLANNVPTEAGHGNIWIPEQEEESNG